MPLLDKIVSATTYHPRPVTPTSGHQPSRTRGYSAPSGGSRLPVDDVRNRESHRRSLHVLVSIRGGSFRASFQSLKMT